MPLSCFRDIDLRNYENQQIIDNFFICKAVSKIFKEKYELVSQLCGTFKDIPDVWMKGGHWSCYACIFSQMILPTLIRCSSECCSTERIFEIKPEIMPEILVSPRKNKHNQFSLILKH